MLNHKKIAILLKGSIYRKQGLFNASLNRTKHLIEHSKFEYDFILLSEYDPWLVRLLRGTKKQTTPESVNIDGIKITILWRRFSLIDYILSVRLHRKPFFEEKYYSSIWKMLRGYDFIIAHSMPAGRIALDTKKHFNIPFSVTWHGSDTHTLPFVNQAAMASIKQVIETADVNFYVSDALRCLSSRISQRGRKEVLYNGADERFFRYDDRQKAYLKKKFKVEGKKIVTFVGNFIEVKNILVVPEIFRHIHKYEKNVIFWMLGDGKYRKQIEERINDLPVILWGNRPPEEIPDFLNCTNVQILPSLNEGLPLSMVEALRCGCHAVGSNVGGIPEVIGIENCISLDDPEYIKHFAEKVIYFLNDGANDLQDAASCFDWNMAASKESEIILRIIN